jgi:hypothetical protein
MRACCSGYCGEVSAVAAGLRYGQYFSQFDIREIALRPKKHQQVGLGLLPLILPLASPGKAIHSSKD